MSVLYPAKLGRWFLLRALCLQGSPAGAWHPRKHKADIFLVSTGAAENELAAQAVTFPRELAPLGAGALHGGRKKS